MMPILHEAGQRVAFALRLLLHAVTDAAAC